MAKLLGPLQPRGGEATSGFLAWSRSDLKSDSSLATSLEVSFGGSPKAATTWKKMPTNALAACRDGT
jgi:hypothetical protein